MAAPASGVLHPDAIGHGHRRRPVWWSTVAVVAMLAGTFVAILGGPGQASADGSASYATQTASGPPDLINLSELTNGVDDIGGSGALGQVGPGAASSADTVYAATPDQIASLEDFEAQAVDNLINDHQLGTGDYDLVLSYAREDADSELWALIYQALLTPAGESLPGLSSSDVSNVQAWMQSVFQRETLLDANDAAYEYARFAGADVTQFESDLATYEAPLTIAGNGGPLVTPTDLESDLGVIPGVTNPTLNGYTDGLGPGTSQSASNGDGYCAYQAPNPLQGQWTNSIYNLTDGTSTAPQTCYTGCTSIVVCNIPTPSMANFVDWGQADVTESLFGSADDASRSISVSTGAAIGAAVADTDGVFLGAGVATSSAVAAAASGSTFQTAVFPYAAQPFFQASSEFSGGLEAAGESAEEAAETAIEAAEVSAGEVAATGIGVIVTAVIIALSAAVQEGITLLGNENLPQQLTSDIVAAQSGPAPDIASVAGTSSGLGGLYSLFLGSLTPNPTYNSCTNQTLGGDLAPSFPTSPCLNAAPIPAPSSADPQFLVTAQGGSLTQQQEYATWQDTTTGITNYAYLHGNWIVSDAGGQGLPSETVMTDRFTYTDWGGNEYTAWIDTDGPSPGFLSVLTADLATFQPDQCTSLQTAPSAPTECFISPTVDTVSASGTDQTIGLTGAARDTSGAVGPPCSVDDGCLPSPMPPPGEDTTTETLTASPTPATVGRAVTLTAALGQNLGVNLDGGTITFADDAGTLCSAVPVTIVDVTTPLGGGVVETTPTPEASCTASFPVVETADVSASFNGTPPDQTPDESFNGLTPATAYLALPVLAPSALSVEAPGQVTVGQPVVLIGQLDAPGASVGGAITFTAGNQTLCSVPVPPAAPYRVECDETPTASGSQTITADYSGDPATLPAVAQPLQLSINALHTRLALAFAPAFPTVGQATTFTATLTSETAASALPAPSGTVDFTEAPDTTVCSDVPLQTSASGALTATCTVTPQSDEPLGMTATYSGDATTAVAMSNPLRVDAAPGSTSTTVTPSTSTPTVGQQVTFTAAVANLAPDLAGPAPGGQVSFTDGSGHALCTAVALSTIAPYDATCNQTWSASGPQTVNAVFQTSDRDADSGSSGSATVAVAGPPDAPTAVTATAGDGSATVSFTPPVGDGDSSLTGYTVTTTDTSNPANGAQSAPGTGSPITVTGLTDGDSYTVTVTATNAAALTSLPSAPSNSFTPQGAQSITFTSATPTAAVVGQTYEVAATGGASGNPVTFSSGSPSVCTVAGSTVTGSTVTFTGVGPCVVDADQAGDTAYTAGQGQQTVVVGPAPTTLVALPLLNGAHPAAFRNVATLTDTATGQPVAGMTVVFTTGSAGTRVCAAVTNSAGTATCVNRSKALKEIANGGYTATFAATTDYLASTAHGKLFGKLLPKPSPKAVECLESIAGQGAGIVGADPQAVRRALWRCVSRPTAKTGRSEG